MPRCVLSRPRLDPCRIIVLDHVPRKELPPSSWVPKDPVKIFNGFAVASNVQKTFNHSIGHHNSNLHSVVNPVLLPDQGISSLYVLCCSHPDTGCHVNPYNFPICYQTDPAWYLNVSCRTVVCGCLLLLFQKTNRTDNNNREAVISLLTRKLQDNVDPPDLKYRMDSGSKLNSIQHCQLFWRLGDIWIIAYNNWHQNCFTWIIVILSVLCSRVPDCIFCSWMVF